MDVDSNTNTNEEASPSLLLLLLLQIDAHVHVAVASIYIESAFRAAQDLAARSSTANNKTSTANHESCTTTGVLVTHVPANLSSESKQGKKADMPKSATDSNTRSRTVPLPTFSAQGDDKPTQSDNTLDVEQHPEWPTEHTELTKRNSTLTNDGISIKAGQGCLLPPSFFGVLDNETEEERQRRRAVFAAKRQRHVLANNLRAHYDAILAAVSDEEQGSQQLQQDI